MKGLNLNREEIKNNIENFLIHTDVTDKLKIIEKKITTIYTIPFKNGDGILEVFYLKNGTTTLGINKGKNQKDILELAKFIKKNCCYDERKNISYSIELTTQNNINDLFEWIGCILEDCFSFKSKKTDSAIEYDLSYKDEKIKINFYNNGRMLIQGKPLKMFNIISSYLIEIGLIQLDKVLGKDKLYDLDITKEKCLEKLKLETPNAEKHLGENLKNIISVSLIFKDIQIELPDYTAYVFPILRGVEGVLKKILVHSNIQFSDHKFNIFDKYNNNFILKKKYSPPLKYEIETLYNFYSKHRHTLFHTETLDIVTRTIQTKEEAINIIDDAISLIENSLSKL